MQPSADQVPREATVLEETRLPEPLRPTRDPGTEMLRPRGLHAFWPLAPVGSQRLLQRTLVDAPMPELPLDRERAPAALGPASREGRREADIIGKTAGRKLGRDLRRERRIEALVGETAGELGDTVLAPGEQ